MAAIAVCSHYHVSITLNLLLLTSFEFCKFIFIVKPVVLSCVTIFSDNLEKVLTWLSIFEFYLFLKLVSASVYFRDLNRMVPI